jgi:hypothetical protein
VQSLKLGPLNPFFTSISTESSSGGILYFLLIDLSINGRDFINILIYYTHHGFNGRNNSPSPPAPTAIGNIQYVTASEPADSHIQPSHHS